MMTILDPQGNEVEINASQRGGFVEVHLRAVDRYRLVNGALSQNLLYRDPIIERDPETGEEVVVGYEDEIKQSPGVNLEHIGPIVLQPAVKDSDGNEITPAVMDHRHHANLRLAEPLLSKVGPDGYLLWLRTSLLWMKYGVPVEPNKAEISRELNGIEMIDPDSVSSPYLVWL